MKNRISIRPLRRIEEYHACEDIQKAVWEFTDREIIPSNELLNIQHNGGIVLGAFTANSRMVGFVFGFVGLRKPRFTHCSRMVAVLPEYRDSDIGYRLKLAQRNFVLKQNLKLITWTFDPLQSINAYFNVEKLGVIIREYHVNIYGNSSSIFNRGFPTDRFTADWWITSQRVKKRLSNKLPKNLSVPDILTNYTHCLAVTTRIKPNQFIAPQLSRLNMHTPLVIVEIPSNIMTIKKQDITLARKWRSVTRQIFLTYFKKSYIITGVTSGMVDNLRRSFYILERIKKTFYA
jgi:predicted GNAT superfamily acetyltransferase